MYKNYEEQRAAAEAASWALHRGQVDKAGEPYYLHPQRVALAVETWGVGVGWPPERVAVAVQVALLHDVLEDTDITSRDLMHNIGVFHQAVSLIEAISFRHENPEETRSDYYARLKAHKDKHILLAVKKADIDDNMRVDRLAKLDDETKLRLIEKYSKAYEELGL